MQRDSSGVVHACLVKEASAPEVYLAYGDTKFHITDPDSFDAMGLRWDKVETVQDGLLADLVRVELGPSAPVRASDVFFTGDEEDGSKASTSRVRDHVLVAGRLAGPPHWNYPGTDAQSNPAGPGSRPWVEDVHYAVVLDADFIDRLYGPDGLSTALVDATLHGNAAIPGLETRSRPFGDLAPDAGGRRYATVGAFQLRDVGGGTTWDPHSQSLAQPALHVELNCWRTDTHLGPIRDPNGPYRVKGRGPAPQGWVNVHKDVQAGPTWIATTEIPPWLPVPWSGIVTDCWWPFDPDNPDGGARALGTGDAVLLFGTIWQDHLHRDETGPWSDWEVRWPGQGGWVEMHPPDWIHRFQIGPPSRTAHAFDGTAVPGTAPPGRQGRLYPDQPGRRVTGAVPSGPPVEVIDARFTDAARADMICERHGVSVDAGNTVKVDVQMRAPQSTVDFYRATYLVSWEFPPQPRSMTVPTVGVAEVDTPVTVTVNAQDSLSDEAVHGDVVIEGTRVAGTGEPFTRTFGGHWEWVFDRDPRGHPTRRRIRVADAVAAHVSASGYADSAIVFQFPSGEL